MKDKVDEVVFNKVYCCFSNDNLDIENSIGLAFIDFVNKKKQEKNISQKKVENYNQ